jgi:hypothetical protein
VASADPTSTSPGHRFIAPLLGIACLSGACGQAPAEVETRVHVGQKLPEAQHAWVHEARADGPAPEFAAAAQVWAAIRSDWRESNPRATGEVSPQSVHRANSITRPPQTPEELDELLAQLRKGPIDEVALPAHNLLKTHPSAWPQLRELLLGPREGSKKEFTNIVRLFGGDVPNRYGHFALHWKKNHGYAVKVSEDWFKDLLSLPLGKVSHMLHPVYRDALLVVAGLHGAAHIARSEPALAGEVVETLLDAAYMHRGTFRDEVGRAMVSVGEDAVPHLVLASVLPKGGRDDDPAHMRARYASYNLDQMDRLAPGRALAAASAEPRRLVALLDAYGVAKVGDAAGPILSVVNDPSPGVRAAAREALLAYVTGPPPRMKTRSVRRLGGKSVRRQAYLSYRALAANAIWSTLESEAPELLEEPCDTRREDGSYDQRCIDQPARLVQAWFKRLDTQREKAERLDLTEALAAANVEPVASADTLSLMLRDGSVQLDTERRSEVVEVMLRAAAEAGDPTLEAGKLRSAAKLIEADEPDRARGLRAKALRVEAGAEGLPQQGKSMLLAQAEQLAPSVAAAPSDSDLEATNEDEPKAAVHTKLLFGVLNLMAAFGCLAWLGARRRRPHQA